jgi:protoporphyrinogen/coproporphyrinogen III oxidase
VTAGERVAVVGGGPAGLAAALALTEAGATATVYEASSQAGGLLQTAELDGALVDVGVQLISSTHDAVFAAAQASGAAELLQRSAGHDALWRKGRAHGITYGSVSSMVASGALPMALKLKLGAKYLPFLKSEARGLDANDPAATGGASFDGDSIGAWGRRELGEDFVELLAYPLLAAYYGARPEETSAAMYHALARVGMDVRVYGAAGGFGALAAALARTIESRGGRLETGRRVQAVSYGGDDVAIDGDVYDGVILAVPAPAAAALLRDAAAGSGGATGGAAGVVEWLAAVETRRTFTVAYRLDRAFPGDWFGLSFPRITEQGRRVAALCVQSRKLPDLVPSGDAVVVIPAPGAAQELYDGNDDAVAEALLSDMEAAVPGSARRVTATALHRHDGGYSLFGPGYLRRLRAFPAAMMPPRTALAGDYLVAPSVDGAMRSGRRAAQRLLQDLAAARG